MSLPGINIESEDKFCKEIECEKNEHGVYVYTSSNGAHIISLNYILLEYKNWLVENKILKQI